MTARYALVDAQSRHGTTPAGWSYTRAFFLMLLLIGFIGYPAATGRKDDELWLDSYNEQLIRLCMGCWTLVGLGILCCSRSRSSTGSQSPTVEMGAASGVRAPSARIMYLDNLKTILTIQVMVHHTVGGFSDQSGFVNVGCRYNSFNVVAALIMSVNNAFFMSLFFFIAGYFTPSSYRRKGARNFLLDRLTRLGVPVVIYGVLFGPRFSNLLSLLEGRPYGDDPWFDFNTPYVSITWFPNWLLVLSVAFAVLQRAPHVHSSTDTCCIPARLPKVTSMLAVGATMGVAWGLLYFVTGLVPENFIGMPTEPLSLPFYILFFFGGCTAGSNGWLEVDLPNLTRSQCCVAYLFSFACVLGLLLFLLYEYAHNGGVILNARGRPRHNLTHLAFDRNWFSVAVYHMFGGAFSFTMSLTCVHLCSMHLAFSNRVTRWLAANSYAAYLLQEPVIMVAVYSYRGVLGFLGGPVFERCDSSVEASDADLLHRFGHLAGGFVYTTTFCVVFTWLIAAALRAIPGVRNIL